MPKLSSKIQKMPLARLLCGCLSLAISSSATKSDHTKGNYVIQQSPLFFEMPPSKPREGKHSSAGGSPERFIPHRSRSRRAAEETETRWRRERQESAAGGEGRGLEKALEGPGRRSSSCCAMAAVLFPAFTHFSYARFFAGEGRRGFMSARAHFQRKVLYQPCDAG